METIDRYVNAIKKYPLLSREEELALARHYRQTGDPRARDQLVCANLRFVVKTAHEYRGYHLKLSDLIQEGNVGLLVAVGKFEPERGHRLISYAVWWIRAYMWGYAMRSWSLVKLGTTQAQRRLFFSLRAARDRADQAAGAGEIGDSAEIARELGVEEHEVAEMETRLNSRDASLDAKPEGNGRRTPMDQLVDDAANTEDQFGLTEMRQIVHQHVRALAPNLNEKEGYILAHRLLTDDTQTLRQIGQHFQISRERTRQIEGNVIKKLGVSFADADLDFAA